MKTLIICALLVVAGTIAKAQSSTASLYITLSDVQSVTLTGKAIAEAINLKNPEAKDNPAIRLLSRAGLQVRKIVSQTTDYEKLYKEFASAAVSYGYAHSAVDAAEKVRRSNPAASVRPMHVIYQIDPR